MELSEKETAPYQQWAKAAKRLGAAQAKVIATASVVTATWVRLKCQFGCGGYGQHLTCPPYSPTPEQTRAMLGEYGIALLVHAPGDGHWESIKRIVSDLEREVFLAGFYKAFQFNPPAASETVQSATAIPRSPSAVMREAAQRVAARR